MYGAESVSYLMISKDLRIACSGHAKNLLTNRGAMVVVQPVRLQESDSGTVIVLVSPFLRLQPCLLTVRLLPLLPSQPRQFPLTVSHPALFTPLPF
jgi:hypothetical protein